MTGTGDRDLAWFLARIPDPTGPDQPPLTADDWNRESAEAFIAKRTGTIRAMHSRGALRLHGGGAEGHTAELGQIGSIAAGWQKAVSATGAALENRTRALRGVLPADIVRRTTLLLNAAPSPGSIVLNVEPQSPPMDEVEPGGNISVIEPPPQPLADRASRTLISLLANFAGTGPAIDDGLIGTLRDLGPRVGSSLSSLAQAISRANITVDASWAEPGAATVRASVTPATASRLRAFVAGRGLDAEEQIITGTLSTVSDRQRWQVELPGGEIESMRASELSSEEVARWHVGSAVRIRAIVTLREQPDGNVRRTYTIVSLEPLDDS